LLRPLRSRPPAGRAPTRDYVLSTRHYCTLSADKPLLEPQEDQLGYALFARHLAFSLIKMVPAEGFVVAIYGPWGSGKTTLLNFLFHYFKQAPPAEQPIIVPFNPWWFSGHEKLAKHFFDQLQSSLASSDVDLAALQGKIAEFADMVSELPASIHIPYISIGKIAVEFTPMKSSVKNVIKLKMEIAEELRKQSRRIFVTVDDIDRLNPDEIRQLFGIIKSVADFPNVVYLLTFDKKVVIEALRESQGISGENYLEKIVQFPFELPLPDQSSLCRLLFARLEDIMADTPEGLFDQTYWGNVFMRGIEHFISTPRKINLLTNTLSVTYPAVQGEVNPVDFIGIETLRIFCPEAYNMIRTYPEKFTGREWAVSKIEQLRTFQDSWVNQIAEENREAVRGMLSQLFPKLGEMWGDLGFDPPNEASWRKQLRICSPDIFPIFFHLALPQGGISNAEIMVILSLAHNPQDFSARLLDLVAQVRPDGFTRLHAFLDRVMDYTGKEIAAESIPAIFLSLFDVGDQFIRSEDEGSGKVPIGNDQRVAQIILQLLRRLPWETRGDALKQAITPGRAVFTSVKIIMELGKISGKFAVAEGPKAEALIPPDILADLEQLVLAKVRSAAADASLLQCPKLPEILSLWQNLAGDAEPITWVSQVGQDDHNLATLLEKFMEKNASHSMIQADADRRYRLNPKVLAPFLDPGSLLDRARRLAKSAWLGEPQKDALRYFIKDSDPKGR
jgi:predicted KAP-like P-loop ATPase